MNKTYAIEIIIRERFKQDCKREWSRTPYYQNNEVKVHQQFDKNIGRMHQFFNNTFFNYEKLCNLNLYHKIIERLLDTLKDELSDDAARMTETYPCKFIVRFLENNKDINNSFETGMYLFISTPKTT